MVRVICHKHTSEESNEKPDLHYKRLSTGEDVMNGLECFIWGGGKTMNNQFRFLFQMPEKDPNKMKTEEKQDL